MAWKDGNDSGVHIHQHHRQPKPTKVYRQGDGDFYAVLVVLVAVVIGIFYLIDKAVKFYDYVMTYFGVWFG